MDDLMIRRGERSINGEITTHTHTVVFARPLTESEKHLFAQIIQGFYYTVHFSRQFGSDLVAELVIEFTRLETIQPQSVPAVREPRPDYEAKPTEPSETQG